MKQSTKYPFTMVWPYHNENKTNHHHCNSFTVFLRSHSTRLAPNRSCMSFILSEFACALQTKRKQTKLGLSVLCVRTIYSFSSVISVENGSLVIKFYEFRSCIRKMHTRSCYIPLLFLFVYCFFRLLGIVK